jgi:2-dehydro-3-deoxygluconokinase
MAAQSPDLITFGESMALCMAPDYKGLDQAASLELTFGGAESNLAIGAARLGVSSGWFGALGDDPFGLKILKAIRGEGVDVSRARLVPGEQTGVMFRDNPGGKLSVYYYRKLSAASRMKPSDLDAAYIRGSKILHVTGITCAISESARDTVREAVRIAKEAGVKVSFDPNLRLKLWTIEEAREVLLPIAEQADYFLPGYDELQLLYDTTDQEAIFGRLEKLSAVSVVKGVGETTVIVEGGRRTAVPFHKAEKVVDTVGAGDGFCAGLLAGLLKGWTIEEAVRLASICGSLVVQGRGDWEATPDWRTVERLLTDQKRIER